MLTWFRRLFVQAPAIRDLRERVSNLEADLDYLAADVKKVRGRVTGGVRNAKLQPADADIPERITGAQRAWLESLDPISRKIHLQRIGITEYGRMLKGGT